jgi:hypothetical protein
MADNPTTKQQALKPNDVPATPSPALEPLHLLVGEWSYEGSHVGLPGEVLRGKTSFAWLEGTRFLIQREMIDHPEMPDSIAIIGAGDTGSPLVQHYFDSRGVARVYQMSLSDRIWKRWRDEPGFLQRSAGTLSDDDTTISIRSELSRDGVSWERDLNLTYKKIK